MEKVRIISKIQNKNRLFEVGKEGVTHILDFSKYYPMFGVYINNFHRITIYGEPFIVFYNIVEVEED